MNREVNRGLVGDRIMIDSGEGIFFQPLFDRILVKPKRTKEKTKYGIIIPEEAKIEETMGEVVAVGYGTFNDNNEFIPRDPLFQVGDIVVFKEFTGTHVSLPCDDEFVSYLIMWDRDVIGVLKRLPEEPADG